MTSISVVIPALNEEESVGPAIQDLYAVLKDVTSEYEILVVNDGSTDRTRERAEAAGARVVNHPQNMGYGRSLKTGILAARYENIIICDADGTYPVQYIPSMVEEYGKGFDMVVGARQGEAYRENLIKSLLRRVLKFLAEFSSGREIPDINSGFRIFRRGYVLPHLKQMCDTFSYTTSLTLAFMMTGRSVSYIPVPYHRRVGKTKVNVLRDSFRTSIYIVQAILYYSPLKIFIVFSVITVLLSIFSFVVGILFHIHTGFALGVGGLLTTLIIFSMGLLADLLRQIMDK
jgi:glycosyltransferase involved in cell wall biosynthesis